MEKRDAPRLEEAHGKIIAARTSSSWKNRYGFRVRSRLCSSISVWSRQNVSFRKRCRFLATYIALLHPYLLPRENQQEKSSWSVMIDENGKSVDSLFATDPSAGSATITREAKLPGHLLGFGDDQWAFWRCICLRGAGLPVAQVLELAAPDCAAAADQLIQDELQLAKKETSSTYSKFEQLFHDATAQVSQAIHRIAGSDRFREAIVWQNRQAIHTGIASLLRRPPGSTHQAFKHRKHEALVANYLQRYCTKNDTIGFFGPVGLARLVPSGEAIAVRPGPHLLAARNVYFEAWCIDALAETLAQDKAILPWLAPRRLPHIYIDGTVLYLPFTKPLTLSRSHASVLQACDGKRTAQAIALELTGNPSSGLRTEQEVYIILEQLSAMKRISWTLEISPEGTHPECHLRQLLQRIGDERLRSTNLEILATLERARDAVAQAAGDAEQLDQALANMEATFTNLTGIAPTRSDGKTYAARTLVYEDCRRDIEVDLGPDLVCALGQPLTLLLASARWFTYHVANLYRQAFMDAYSELAEEHDSLTVDFASFWLWVQPLLFDEDARLVDLLLPEFQQRWSDILALSDSQSHLTFTSEELGPRVLAAFDAPKPGWNAARYHSPDVLIQASSPEAIRDGDYQLVLGEFHIAMNTLQIEAFLAQHPASEELLHSAALDVPEPRILPVLSKQSFPVSRVRPALITPKDIRLLYSADTCVATQSQVLATGSLVVESVGEELVVRTRDGRWRFDIIEVFAEFLSRIVFSCFKIVPPSKHTHRVTIDRLVIARETWRFAPAEIDFANEKAAANRFLGARRWIRAHNLPRFVFVKVPSEQKPCFIDFASPIYVDIFAKMVRHNMQIDAAEASIIVSEMLPGPEQTWLPDAGAAHYTSELRFVAVDLVKAD